ncbi:MAG: SUMF1/EgtB/PvdO family nonheme iron enzyme [Chloroflexota bacterium]
MIVFISYSSKDRDFAVKLAEDLKRDGFNVWLDSWEIKGRQPYWTEIQEGLEACSHFLFIISPDSIDPNGGAVIELFHATGLKRRPIIVPVMARSTPYDDLPILISPGRLQIHDCVRHPYAEMLPKIEDALGKAAPTTPSATQMNRAKHIGINPHQRVNMGIIAAVVLLLILGGGLLISQFGQQGGSPTPTVTTQPAVEQNNTPTAPIQSATLSPSATSTNTPLPPTTAVPTAIPTTSVPPTNVPPSAVPTAIPTILPTAISTLSPTANALSPVTANNQWIPQFQDFDGVTMARVPSGCFTMGTENPPPGGIYGIYDDEKPTTKICFDKPFWIDKTDVTQSQFARLKGMVAHSSAFTGDNRPIESVTWFEARDFCQNQRKSRLPTEAEWEYAARGPDDLIYPWGNTFVADNTVFSSNQTADVGSRPTGASWVGAQDMGGNLWQWVSTLYRPYLYNKDDGRENNIDTKNPRSLRGGSWTNANTDYLRTANRNQNYPSLKFNYYGFRCARSE